MENFKGEISTVVTTFFDGIFTDGANAAQHIARANLMHSAKVKGLEYNESDHPNVQQTSIFDTWPDYQPSADLADQFLNPDYTAMKIASYLFLYINLLLQLVFAPAQLGRYRWVMYVNNTYDEALMNEVKAQQREAMSACFRLFYTEPYDLLYVFYTLFYNMGIYLLYNLVWIWEIIDATFGFTTDGVIYAFGQILDLVNFMVTDYDAFVAIIQDDIWRLMAVFLFWPFYLAWIIFAWLFGLDMTPNS